MHAPRPPSPPEQVLALWLASDSHLGFDPPLPGTYGRPAHLGSAQQQAQQRSSSAPEPHPGPRSVADASSQFPEVPEPPTGGGGSSPASRPAASRPRSRDQVGRRSLSVLWREYLALGDRLGHTMGASADGPLAAGGYDRPKSLASKLLPLLCPPTDGLDMRAATKRLASAFASASLLVLTLSPLVVPAWLWLVRHELLLGHLGDAAGAAAGGLLLLLAFNAAAGAASVARADKQRGVFSAAAREAYQTAPRQAWPAGATPFATSTAQHVAGAAAGGPARRAPGGGGGTAGPRAAAGSGDHVRAVSAASEEQVRRAKRLIIRLEGFLFGNELSEGDVPRDQLHARVKVLCGQLHVPYPDAPAGAPKPTLPELLRLLDQVEAAVGLRGQQQQHQSAAASAPPLRPE